MQVSRQCGEWREWRAWRSILLKHEENYAFHSRQNSETFDVLRAFLSLVVAKLSDLKNSPFFGAPCIYMKFVSEMFKLT